MQTEIAESETEDDVLALVPAHCLMCGSNEFAFIPESHDIICWNCSTGFKPHEYDALQKTSEKVN